MIWEDTQDILLRKVHCTTEFLMLPYTHTYVYIRICMNACVDNRTLNYFCKDLQNLNSGYFKEYSKTYFSHYRLLKLINFKTKSYSYFKKIFMIHDCFHISFFFYFN